MTYCSTAPKTCEACPSINAELAWRPGSLGSLQSVYNNGNDPLGFVGAVGARELNDLWAGLASVRVNAPVTHAGPIPWTNDWTGASPGEALAALRFYHMAAGPGLTHSASPPSLPVVDFHRALTFINQHPALQRALGLVFDVAIDQRNVAGIGNIWKSEGCWEAHVDPWRRVSAVSDEEAVACVMRARPRMLRSGLEGPRHADFQVYRHSGGGRCPRCGSPIRSKPQGDDNRMTYWCPGCQH